MLSMTPGRRLLLPIAASFVLSGIWACTRATGAPDMRSDNALDRARGAVKAADEGDPAAVHTLVNLLEDWDEAVRMYAILALQRLCGEDLGYRYYAPPEVRSRAVARWRDALRRGEVTVVATPVPAADEPEPDAPALSGGAPPGASSGDHDGAALQ
jgi:hypothetical protein